MLLGLRVYLIEDPFALKVEAGLLIDVEPEVLAGVEEVGLEFEVIP